VAGQEYTLEPGDSLLFTSNMPHTWSNLLEENSRAIIVMAVTEDERRVKIPFPV
jgi:quercetin dioxygenase-like cupin family protein